MESYYINLRLQQKLKTLDSVKVLSLLSPFGYGKSTIIEDLKQQQTTYKKEHIWHFDGKFGDFTCFLNHLQNFSLDSLTPLFPKEKHFFVENYLPPEEPILFIVENCHLFPQDTWQDFLDKWLFWLPDSCQLWLTGELPFLTSNQELALGQRLLEITTEDLSLQPEEILLYGKQFNLTLTKLWGDLLYVETKGWFSPLYFIFNTWQKKQQLPHFSAFQQKLIKSFSSLETLPKGMCFLLYREETIPLPALFALFGKGNWADFLKELNQLKFIQIDFHHQTVAMHPLFKNALKENPQFFPSSYWQKKYQFALANWYEVNDYYPEAFLSYLKLDDTKALFRLVKHHGPYLFSGKVRSLFHTWYQTLTKEDFLNHLETSLTLLLFLVAFQKKAPFEKLKVLLFEKIQQLPPEKKAPLLGEYYLILSFSAFHHLKEMIFYQKKALPYLNKKDFQLDDLSWWTFGSPSLLMLYGNQQSSLKENFQFFHDYLNNFPENTFSFSQSATLIAKAELLFLKGKWVALEIPLQQGLYLAHEKQDSQLLICGYFLQERKNILQGKATLGEVSPFSLPKLTPFHQQSYEIANSLLYILQKKFHLVPNWVKTGDFSTLEVFEPSFPQLFIIHLEYLLFSGYFDLILAKETEINHYLLQGSLVNALYGHILLSAAYLKQNYFTVGQTHFQKALHLSVSDEIMTPFVENFSYLADFFQQEKKLPYHLQGLIANTSTNTFQPSPWLSNFALTSGEQEVVALAQKNLSNQEIATTLFLAPGTVKQYFNRIYSKLQIKGSGKNKRQELLKRLQENY